MGKLAIAVMALCLFSAASGAQEIQGVHPDDSTPVQVGVGFTFVNFHEVPGQNFNNAGITASAVYRRDALGFEGEVTDSGRAQNGVSSRLLFVGGGARYYMGAFSSVRPWIHAEAGLADLSPQTSYGTSQGLGYKAGAGFDFNPRRSRIEYRVSADMLGTTFFGTYQVSPQISFSLILPVGRY